MRSLDGDVVVGPGDRGVLRRLMRGCSRCIHAIRSLKRSRWRRDRWWGSRWCRGARKHEGALTRVAICKITREIETGVAPARAFCGGVTMPATPLAEKCNAWGETAFVGRVDGMPIGATGVSAGVRREVVYARRALRRGCGGDAGCGARHACIHLWSHVHA